MQTVPECPDTTNPAGDTPNALHALREQFCNFEIKTTVDKSLSRDLAPGFLLPYLLQFDALTYRRWEYWCEGMERGALPDGPIPKVDWIHMANPRTEKMLETALNTVPQHGSWQTMGSTEYFRYFLSWLLWGFGHPGYDEPTEPVGCEGASLRLYQVFNLCAWMLWPYDYLGNLLAESAYRGQGFFPTPMNVCQMTTDMLMGTGEDMRLRTVCDPCVGTGRFLLTASNYSLRLYGQDIDQMMCQATLVNGYLYAPWLVKPFPFLDHDNLDRSQSHRISESITAQAPAHLTELLGDTEFDNIHAPACEPIKKRRRKVAEDLNQGTLF
ncbi:MAG: hypothetical protein JWN14_1005 [Chthonomonadales bacterium]|nr:hypothetical protein [Chthonomonadales bacterium]